MLYNVRNWFWQVGDDETRFWSSAEAAYKNHDSGAAQDWLRAGGVPTKVPDEATLWEVLQQQYPGGLPPATAWHVPIHLFRKRLEDAGKWADVASLMAESPDVMLKLLTLEQGVAHDDEDAIELLQSAGADPEAILARP